MERNGTAKEQHQEQEVLGQGQDGSKEAVKSTPPEETGV